MSVQINPSDLPSTPTHFAPLPEGRIAYDDQGRGQLVILVPGIGDLRSQYRFVAPALAQAGFRVVTMDLRGFGESDASFARYDGQAIGEDILGLIRHIDAGPAIVMGNSIAAGAALWAAAEAPDLVTKFVLIGGFTRGPHMAAPTRLLVKTLMAGPWRTAVWMSIHNTLFPLRKPADHDEHRANMRANLKQAGRSAALGQMMTSNHDHAEARYGEIRTPSLFVMGTADSDFDDPIKEAEEVSAAIGGATLFIEGAGHYPHVEAPAAFVEGVLPFLAESRLAASA